MSQVPEVICPKCKKQFAEHQLRMIQLTKESCPYCNHTIRYEEGWGSTNVQLMVAADVSAVDAWVNNHRESLGVKVDQRNHPTSQNTKLWSVETPYPCDCEIAYDLKRPNFVAVRFCTTEKAEMIEGNERLIQAACAKHGVQPHGVRHTDGITGKVELTWGAVQYISVDTLCEELFATIFKRLDAAVTEVLGSLGT